MDSYPRALEQPSSFRRSRETAHRRESGDSETESAVSDDGKFGPNGICGPLSSLCNTHCSNQRKANQAHSRHPGVVNGTVDVQRRSNAPTERIRVDDRKTKRTATTISNHRGATKASPAKTEDVATQRPANDPRRSLSPSDSAPGHGTDITADNMTEIDGQHGIRQFQSIYFEREEEPNYTRGPIRIISASDGIDDSCAALLLNLRFSDNAKTAIRMQRELDDEINEGQKRDATAKLSLQSLEENLEQHHSRRAELVRGATGKTSEGFAALERELPGLNKKIDKLEGLMRKETYDHQQRQTNLQARYGASCEAQRTVNRYLESAFVDARLMSPSHEKAADTPDSLGRFTLESDHDGPFGNAADHSRRTSIQGWQKASAGRFGQVYGTGNAPAPDPSSPRFIESTRSQNSSTEQFASVVKSPEYVAAMNLHKEYVVARNRLCDAKLDFHLRGETRDQEDYVVSQLLQDSGSLQGIAQEFLDLHWMKRISKLTRDRIDAKAICQKAKAAEIEGGWVLDNRIHDINAKYACDYHPVQRIYAEGAPIKEFDKGSISSGGYPASQEAISQASASRERVEEWRQVASESQGVPGSSVASATPRNCDPRKGDEPDR